MIIVSQNAHYRLVPYMRKRVKLEYGLAFKEIYSKHWSAPQSRQGQSYLDAIKALACCTWSDKMIDQDMKLLDVSVKSWSKKYETGLKLLNDLLADVNE